MIRCDFHVHTSFCDGENTPEEMVLAALEKKITRLGFSGHAHTPFDERYCMSPEGTRRYYETVRALGEKYRERITILCGLEQDLYSDPPGPGFDYLIGSVHYLKIGEEYLPLDETAEILTEVASRFFGGDMLALAEAYFDSAASLASLRPTVVGHFDLITKFNEKNALFDENDPRYLAAAKRAADALLETGALFEVNTGAMSRGFRAAPYPGREVLSYIIERGGKLLLSSDAHNAAGLLYGFDRGEAFAASLGGLFVTL